MLRPRLLERLDAGLHRKLTLIAAPAGSGKTTLLTAWLAGSQRQVAWLSLDAADGEPARFLTYLVAALRTVAAPVGEDLLPALQAPQPPPSEAILTTLLNEIAAVPHRLVLVLDDYHLIDAHAIDEATTFLLEHLPPQLHLVIASREDPPLPLARLRARNQLTEVRAADLRFTPAEAAAFLQAMNLQLSADEVAALEERTEGWIAGLQLAALSLQGRRDVPASIRAFAGDHRYILDYLGEEVLAHQPAAVRRFLLHTAILERLTGALCEAVTGQEGGSARLEALERGNFFVVPLDERRQWYRYHHLFAEVLLAHLRAEQPDLLPTLHRRASAWYEQHGLAAEAITPANARFFAAPLPVVVHIVCAGFYAILGAFQFADGFRRRWPGWHRLAGRLLVGCGLLVGLSGLWMTLFYALPPSDGPLLYVFRLLFGAAMVASIILGFITVRRGDVRGHRAWMARGYALGLGAGTQVVTLAVGEMIAGPPPENSRALLMGAAWAINLAVAEWAIRRRPAHVTAARAHPASVVGSCLR
ncbi:MAG TPA: DUF2306 domain-containing protein [Chloroflexia bacterium]